MVLCRPGSTEEEDLSAWVEATAGLTAHPLRELLPRESPLGSERADLNALPGDALLKFTVHQASMWAPRRRSHLFPSRRRLVPSLAARRRCCWSTARRSPSTQSWTAATSSASSLPSPIRRVRTALPPARPWRQGAARPRPSGPQALKKRPLSRNNLIPSQRAASPPRRSPTRRWRHPRCSCCRRWPPTWAASASTTLPRWWRRPSTCYTRRTRPALRCRRSRASSSAATARERWGR